MWTELLLYISLQEIEKMSGRKNSQLLDMACETISSIILFTKYCQKFNNN